MNQTLKGDAGQCQETTKVQGENGSFGILCFYSSSGLIKGVWITSSRILNKTTIELCPVLSAYGQNTARVTCHLNSRATVKPSVRDREMIIQSDVSWNNSASTVSILEDDTAHYWTVSLICQTVFMTRTSAESK